MSRACEYGDDSLSVILLRYYANQSFSQALRMDKNYHTYRPLLHILSAPAATHLLRTGLPRGCHRCTYIAHLGYLRYSVATHLPNRPVL